MRSLLLFVPALLLTDVRPAEACGGCFSPQETITAVESHRMVISLSTERTTLWDQIRYSGNPADFVWVLPVPSGAAEIELADALFFEDIDNQTTPVLTAPTLPPLDCPPPPWGGGGPNSAQDAAPAGADAGVDIFQEETVGPYETVVIGSESATALRDWLVAHSYNVPAETLPTIEHYVAAGSVFVVLRLAPELGVDAMQPVRVRYPGYMATFPLKMVTVGASGALDLSLWVIAEQRYEAQNYGTGTIAPSALVWDWATGSSNYGALFTQIIEQHGGRGWVAEYASPLDYLWFSTPDDVAVARTGLRYPYLTRLRTRVLVDHLTDDLVLAPSAEAGDIPRFVQIETSINVPDRQCPDWNGDGQPDSWNDPPPTPASGFMNGCSVGAGSRGAFGLGAFVTLATLLAVRRRARRRR